MSELQRILKRFKPYLYYIRGRDFVTDKHTRESVKKMSDETKKTPLRSVVINYLLSLTDGDTKYLEIGVHDPARNYNKITAATKYSVDPGVEFEANPVDYKMTSDEFFEKLANGKVLEPTVKFDVIFIDGLHLAEQVDKDIMNALNFIKNDGFIVLHDCNPPTEWHARSKFEFAHTPAGGSWNGTTWKAFLKWRQNPEIQSCCIDTDWGVGILSKTQTIGEHLKSADEFYEYKALDQNRQSYLNLITFEELQTRLKVKR